MASTFGETIQVSVFGESHGGGIGVVINGLPAGMSISEDKLYEFMLRRKPGGSPFSTPRKESDRPTILSGLYEGHTTGFPLCAVIHNTDTRSGDYQALADLPRPSHADYTAYLKWHGQADMRGGGHFSGRLTAPLCVAGGIALQILAQKKIFIGAHLQSVCNAQDTPYPMQPDVATLLAPGRKAFPVCDDTAADAMQAEIMAAAKEQDSVGGTIECMVLGLPAGLGDPMFDGMENRIASAIFGVPAIKGIEFGSGFACATMRGSQCNDPFCIDENGSIATKTNHSGGIQGGITNGMPLRFCVAVKPTPSIGKPQQTVSLSRHTEETLVIQGRHDPCIAHRAVPVIEAVTALVILDMLAESGKDT